MIGLDHPNHSSRHRHSSNPSGLDRVALWIIKPIVPKVYREAFIGDLLEEYGIIRREKGPADASRWLWRQVLHSIRPFLLMRLERLLHR
jgi:hypothetical protein